MNFKLSKKSKQKHWNIRIKYLIYGAIFGILVALAFDYVLFRDREFTLVVSNSSQYIQKWNQLTPVKQQQIVVAVLARFPKLAYEGQATPSIWGTINDYTKSDWHVSLPRPSYLPFVYKRVENMSPSTMIMIKMRQKVHTALLKIDYKMLDDFWPTNMISSNPKILQKNWDTQVLKSVKEFSTLRYYNQFKKLFFQEK